MSVKQSAELTEFYRAYAKWLDDGAPTNAVFTRRTGLCTNMETYPMRVSDEMIYQFQFAKLDEVFPFNEGYYQNYREESRRQRCHLNSKRIQWVRDHCNPEE